MNGERQEEEVRGSNPCKGVEIRSFCKFINYYSGELI